MAYSAGFTPHPKVSYANAAPTGTASEAEYLEIALTEPREPEVVRALLDTSLPDGLDVLDAVEARTSGFAERLAASVWELRLPGVDPAEAERAAAAFLAAPTVEVQRRTKSGMRTFDARAAVVDLAVRPASAPASPAVSQPSDGAVGAAGRADATGSEGRVGPTSPVAAAPSPSTGTLPDGPGDRRCAILRLVVRHVTPAVRPDDVLSGLHAVAGLAPPVTVAVTRLAQGPFHAETGTVTDPFVPDREASAAAPGDSRRAAGLAAARAGGASQASRPPEAAEGPG